MSWLLEAPDEAIDTFIVELNDKAEREQAAAARR